MRRPLVLATILLSLPITGCASWRPSIDDATRLAREVACTVCQATGGPTEQADQLADALRVLAVALGQASPKRAEAERILEDLARAQDEQRVRFRRLQELATGAP